MLAKNCLFTNSAGTVMAAVIVGVHAGGYSVGVHSDPNQLYGPVVAPWSSTYDPTPVPLGAGPYSLALVL